MEVTGTLAFLAGLASFLSPCVFSLVPVYVGYLGGRAAGEVTHTNPRWTTFTHGLAFILGFSFIFITLGATASLAGRLLYDLRFILARIGGIIVILFGIHMTGLFRIPFLEYDLRVHDQPQRRLGYLSSFLMGIFFSAGWSPCVGPVLGAILTLAMNGGDLRVGTFLLSAYSAGLAIPFLLAALSIGWVTKILRRYSRIMRYVEIGMGILLIIVGAMLFAGVFETLARFGFFIDFGL